MVSRVYSVDKGNGSPLLQYKGFDRQYNRPSVLVALVLEEDVVETYFLDDTEEARKEFARYLAENNDEGVRDALGFYRRVASATC